MKFCLVNLFLNFNASTINNAIIYFPGDPNTKVFILAPKLIFTFSIYLFLNPHYKESQRILFILATYI
jgi:hypothetical protein